MVGPARGLRLAAQLLRGRSGTGLASGARRASSEAHEPVPYRQFPVLHRSQLIKAELISSAMWFWILWHFWHNSDAVLDLEEASCPRFYSHNNSARATSLIQTLQSGQMKSWGSLLTMKNKT